MNKLNYNKKVRGQGVVEYALTLVLAAVVVLFVLGLVGPAVGNVFSKVNDELGIPHGGTAAFNAWCARKGLPSGYFWGGNPNDVDIAKKTSDGYLEMWMSYQQPYYEAHGWTRVDTIPATSGAMSCP